MRATAVAQPNIALIKYWGKRDRDLNLPAVGSLSVTLGSIGTRTTVDFDPALSADRVYINAHEEESTNRRVRKCLDRFREKAGIAHKAVVTTEKDMVKIPESFIKKNIFYVIKIDVVFENDSDVYDLIKPILPHSHWHHL